MRLIDNKRLRLSGPFTVESLSPDRGLSTCKIAVEVINHYGEEVL